MRDPQEAPMVEPTRILARDLMQRDVVTLRPDSPLREALALLEEHEISGAPVVDASGRPVGFLTTRDVARPDHLEGDRLVDARRETELVDLDADEQEEGFEEEELQILQREGYSPRTLGAGAVQDWMSEEVTSVGPEDDLVGVCRTMARNAIHRVLVLERGRIVGIVTTMDIVRYLAR